MEPTPIPILTSVTIDLPLPHKDLSPNSRKHWRAKMGPKKSNRQTAYYLAVAALNRASPPAWSKAKIELHFFYETTNNKGRRDQDNAIAWCKAYIDGIADAGIVTDDKAFEAPTVIEDHDKAHPRLEITVEGIE